MKGKTVHLLGLWFPNFFLPSTAISSSGDSSLSLQLYTGSHVTVQTLAYHLWYVDCNLGMPVLELLIHLNTTVLINKGSDLETRVSFYLSLGGFVFSVFGFSSSSYQLNATRAVPQFFTEIFLTQEACRVSCFMFSCFSLFHVLKIIQRPLWSEVPLHFARGSLSTAI